MKRKKILLSILVGLVLLSSPLVVRADWAGCHMVLNENRAYSDGEIITLDLLKTRMFGSKIFVDVEISLSGKVTLEYAHSIADKIHDEIEEKIPLVKHCMVHVNPK